MSATLDSDLVAKYFGYCQVLAAGGRTFPVEHLFLEDVFELTEYTLDPEAHAALKSNASSYQKQTLQKASARQQALVKVHYPLQFLNILHILPLASSRRRCN